MKFIKNLIKRILKFSIIIGIVGIAITLIANGLSERAVQRDLETTHESVASSWILTAPDTGIISEEETGIPEEIVSTSLPVNPLEGYKTAYVYSVIDGDTFVLCIDGTDQKVRLIGVNTPESVHPDSEKNVPEGKIASDFVKNLLYTGEEVGIEYDVAMYDKYGRVLAYVYLPDGTMLNNYLLELGYAQVMTIPPNVKYADMFIETQHKAQENNVGFWK